MCLSVTKKRFEVPEEKCFISNFVTCKKWAPFPSGFAICWDLGCITRGVC